LGAAGKGKLGDWGFLPIRWIRRKMNLYSKTFLRGLIKRKRKRVSGRDAPER